jgi:hypothetical protein
MIPARTKKLNCVPQLSEAVSALTKSTARKQHVFPFTSFSNIGGCRIPPLGGASQERFSCRACPSFVARMDHMALLVSR